MPTPARRLWDKPRQYQFALATRQQTPPQAKDPNSRVQGEFRKSG
jgi:hypothetical protein